NLVNGSTISDAVADSKGRIAKNVLAGMTDAAMVEDLYLSTLSRSPTKAEAESALKYLAPGPQTQRAQDLLWALLNSRASCISISASTVHAGSKTPALTAPASRGSRGLVT